MSMKMSEKIKLKPCPFCGSDDVVVEETYTSGYVRCRDCGAEGGFRYSHDEAVAAWNRRTNAKELIARINVSDEQVRRMVDDAVSAAIDDCMEQIRKAVDE